MTWDESGQRSNAVSQLFSTDWHSCSLEEQGKLWIRCWRASIHSGSSFERSIHRRAQQGKGEGRKREKERQAYVAIRQAIYGNDAPIKLLHCAGLVEHSVVLRGNRLHRSLHLFPPTGYSTRATSPRVVDISSSCSRRRIDRPFDRSRIDNRIASCPCSSIIGKLRRLGLRTSNNPARNFRFQR